MSQSVNSGLVQANVTGNVETTTESVLLLNGSTSGTSAANLFTVTAGKIWKIRAIFVQMTAVATSCALKINGVNIVNLIATTTKPASEVMNFSGDHIEMTAGQIVSIGASASSAAKYVSILYTEETA